MSNYKTVIGLLMLCCSSAVNADSITVTTQFPGLDVNTQQQPYNQPIRMSQAVDNAVAKLTAQDYGRIHWSLAKFSHDNLPGSLEEQRSEVITQLSELADYWQRRQRYRYVNSIERLADNIKNWTLQPTVTFGIDPDRLRVDSKINVLLAAATAKTYNLILPAREFQPRRLGLAEDDAAADARYRWLLASNGDIARQPIALYNRSQPSQCYLFNSLTPLVSKAPNACWLKDNVQAHQFIGLSYDARTGRLPDLNRRIAELAKFIVSVKHD